MCAVDAYLRFIDADDGFPPRGRQAAGEEDFADLGCILSSYSLCTRVISLLHLNQISSASQRKRLRYRFDHQMHPHPDKGNFPF